MDTKTDIGVGPLIKEIDITFTDVENNSNRVIIHPKGNGSVNIDVAKNTLGINHFKCIKTGVDDNKQDD